MPRCGLCGKTGKLTRTECCGNWICDDEDQYVPFSYARNSCHRNHMRYTLCGFHWAEGHEGRWQDCKKCREQIAETELYVWYGTNEYNFEKLPNPPKFRLTFCRSCHRRIRLGTEGHTLMPDGSYYCEACASRRPGGGRPSPDRLVDELIESVAEDEGGIDPSPPGRSPGRGEENAESDGEVTPEEEAALLDYLRALLGSDWVSPDSSLQLAADLALPEVGSTLFLDQARRFLKYLVEAGGAGLTPNGWLKRAEVARLLDELDWARREFEPMRSFLKQVGERDVKPIRVIHDVVEAAGLVRRRRERLYVPKRVLPLLEDAQVGLLYRQLFLALFRRLPLDILYGADDSVPSLQQSMAVVLWRLGEIADDWVVLKTLPEEVLLDSVQDDIRQYCPEFPDLRLGLFWHRAVEPLVWFGLLECDREHEGALDFRPGFRLRKTVLFDRFLLFDPFRPAARSEGEGGQEGNRERPRAAGRTKKTPAAPVQLRLAGTEPVPEEPRTEPGRPVKPEPPGRDEWQALHTVAARFKDLAPWQWMYDTDMFGVKDPETGVIGYCSVMGRLGQHYCLAAYMGSWGLSGYIQLLKGAKPQSSAEMLEYQDCLMASFGDRAMLDTRDLGVIRELGLKFRGASAWPLFRRYRRGYFPWFITGAEARFLATALEQALDVATRVRSDSELLRPGEADRYLVRVLRSDEGGRSVWRDERLRPEPMTLEELAAEAGVVSASEQYLDELRRVAGTRHGTWELDIDYLSEPMQDEPDAQPYYPRQLIVADADSGFILGMTLGSPADHVEKFQSQLADAVRTSGWLPDRFLVNSDRAERFLAPIVRALGIPVERGRLKAVAALRRELKKHMPRYYR